MSNVTEITVDGKTYEVSASVIKDIEALLKPYSKTVTLVEVKKEEVFTSKQLFKMAKEAEEAEKNK